MSDLVWCRHLFADSQFVGPPAPTLERAHQYVVVRGRGVLFHDGKRDEFGPGDLMFVAAGTEHRFEDFSDDLTVWVVFFGPEGGEAPEGS